MSEPVATVAAMTGSAPLVGITVWINFGSEMTLGDTESFATKLMEVMLRNCGVTWGPTVSREMLSFGPRTYIVTEDPPFLVEIDTIVAGGCSIATARIDDEHLLSEVALEACDLQIDTDLSGLSICTGVSHPRYGYMSEDVFEHVLEFDSMRDAKLDDLDELDSTNAADTEEASVAVDNADQLALF